MKTTEVDVFLADIRHQDCEEMAGRLDRNSVERLVRITHPRRRAQFILGRFLLRQALRRKYGAVAAEWRLDAASGKPRLVGADVPEISLSHSRELVACAIARVEIGLDVEFCRERDFEALTEQVCSPAELRCFLSFPVSERSARFYRMWTLKEATFKFFGREMQPPECSRQPWARDGYLQYTHFQPSEGYLAALVARSGSPLHPVLNSPLPIEVG